MSARKVALVTGSATGVGGGVALLLARRGYNVVINFTRSKAEALATQSQCEAAGVDTLLAQADVADDLACRRMVADVIARWGRLDALVNNAGIRSFAGGGDWAALDAEVFRRIYEVNVIGTFQMIRASVEYLKASRGAVVNVSLVAGSLGIGSSPAYVCSKGAINALTLNLARSLAPKFGTAR